MDAPHSFLFHQVTIPLRDMVLQCLSFEDLLSFDTAVLAQASLRREQRRAYSQLRTVDHSCTGHSKRALRWFGRKGFDLRRYPFELPQEARQQPNLFVVLPSFHQLCLDGEASLVRLLAQQCGADVDQVVEYGDTTQLYSQAPLHACCTAVAGSRSNRGGEGDDKGRGNPLELEVAMALLDCGASVDVRDHWRHTPLQLACGAGRNGLVQLLLAHEADPLSNSLDGETALHRAARGGHEVCLELVLAAGAALESRNESGCTALLSAAESNQTQCAVLLLRAGADCTVQDDAGDTCLHVAMRSGYAALATELLSQGADCLLQVCNSGGARPLDLALLRVSQIERWLS